MTCSQLVVAGETIDDEEKTWLLEIPCSRTNVETQDCQHRLECDTRYGSIWMGMPPSSWHPSFFFRFLFLLLLLHDYSRASNSEITHFSFPHQDAFHRPKTCPTSTECLKDSFGANGNTHSPNTTDFSSKMTFGNARAFALNANGTIARVLFWSKHAIRSFRWFASG